MKNIIRKFTAFAVLLVMCTGLISGLSEPDKVYAATANVAVGSASGEVGSEVTVTVTMSSSEEIWATEVYISYDTSVVEAVSGYDTGGNGLVKWIDTDSFKSKSRTLTFKIKTAGTASITVGQGTNLAGSDGYMTVTSSAGTITGKAPVTYSTNNNLASLKIDPGVLSPAFSSGTTTYTTAVGADVEKLTVSAVPEDSKAKVSISGTKMDMGNNTTTITVTAEDGSKKVYTIYTTRGSVEEPTTTANEYEDIDVTVNGSVYTLKSDFSQNPLPEGYEESDYDYQGSKIKAGIGVNTKLVLVYLEAKDSTGESGLYVYDSVSKTFTYYVQVNEPSIAYCILPITDSMEKPDGYTLTEYNIAGRDVQVMMNSDRTYCLFYGISSQGVTGWFRYCIADETIQVYDGSMDGVAYTQPEVQDTSANANTISYRNMFYIAAATAVILLIALICTASILGSRISRNKRAFNKAMGELDDEPFMSARDFADRVEEESKYDEDELMDDYEDDEDDELIDDSKTENHKESDEEVEQVELFDIDDK